MTGGLRPLWSVLSKLDLNISNLNILHFFGVYLLSIQGTKALSLCFALKLLYCPSDLYLPLSLMS